MIKEELMHLQTYKLFEDEETVYVERDDVLKLLEQEPCEDAISRAAAVKVASGYCHPSNIAQELAKLPPVTPQPKTGHWLYDKSIDNWRCSECNETPKTMGYCGSANFMAKHFKFCNHCGVRMVDPQGSEDKG